MITIKTVEKILKKNNEKEIENLKLDILSQKDAKTIILHILNELYDYEEESRDASKNGNFLKFIRNYRFQDILKEIENEIKNETENESDFFGSPAPNREDYLIDKNKKFKDIKISKIKLDKMLKSKIKSECCNSYPAICIDENFIYDFEDNQDEMMKTLNGLGRFFFKSDFILDGGYHFDDTEEDFTALLKIKKSFEKNTKLY